ncbi:hypothetical protein COF59_24370 [Bacillus pseudomycoides]|uniref:hypothetical protein n=1 Tax=Bacillus pseudomycoides TaxID=64104 RepID=UPI000BF19302|nr:hypothetical protein [Bacillus pseudomycoides]PEI46976.1 hypothetical protein CN641_11515 [Bacillus pseudomycoides]PHE07163.1 hypothetical protein COF59_24370 [Bacillus pseudomycoides]PHE83673.1 hypothetical protein COF78_30280 [Bacillus pseudomycoides]
MLLFHEDIELGIIKSIGEREVTFHVANQEVTIPLTEEEEQELFNYIELPQNDLIIPINMKTRTICVPTDLEVWNEETMDELIEASSKGAKMNE